MIYHGSPYEVQTDMQGERQRMTTAEMKKWGGRVSAALDQTSPFLLCSCSTRGPLDITVFVCAWICGTCFQLGVLHTYDDV